MTLPRPQRPGSIFDALSHAFDAAGRANIRADLGVSKGLISAWADEDEINGRRMAVADLDRLARVSPGAAEVIARHFAALAGGSYVPQDGLAPSIATATADLALRAAAAVATITRARDPEGPGGSEITARERQDGLEALREVIAAARHGEAALRRAVRDD